MAREALSVPRALYTFIRDSYYSPQPLWHSCLHEAAIICGVLPLLQADLGAGWCSEAVATDASPSGWGECTAELGSCVVKSIARWDERWRYRRLSPEEWAPRRRAMGHADGSHLLTDPRTLGSIDDPRKSLTLGPSELSWIEREGFPEVPDELFKQPFEDTWTTRRFGKFKFDEHIGIKESRVAVWSVIHRANNIDNHRKHHLHFVDNFGVALSHSRGRAHSFGYLQQNRKLAAIFLATGYKAHWRWIPSESNPSDGPSRAFERAAHHVQLTGPKAGLLPDERGQQAWNELSRAFLESDAEFFHFPGAIKHEGGQEGGGDEKASSFARQTSGCDRSPKAKLARRSQGNQCQAAKCAGDSRDRAAGERWAGHCLRETVHQSPVRADLPEVLEKFPGVGSRRKRDRRQELHPSPLPGLCRQAAVGGEARSHLRKNSGSDSALHARCFPGRPASDKENQKGLSKGLSKAEQAANPRRDVCRNLCRVPVGARLHHGKNDSLRAAMPASSRGEAQGAERRLFSTIQRKRVRALVSAARPSGADGSEQNPHLRRQRNHRLPPLAGTAVGTSCPSRRPIRAVLPDHRQGNSREMAASFECHGSAGRSPVSTPPRRCQYRPCREAEIGIGVASSNANQLSSDFKALCEASTFKQDDAEALSCMESVLHSSSREPRGYHVSKRSSSAAERLKEAEKPMRTSAPKSAGRKTEKPMSTSVRAEKPMCTSAPDASLAQENRAAKHVHETSYLSSNQFSATRDHGFLHNAVKSISRRKFVECFAGTARLSNAVARCGIHAESYEISRDSVFENCMSKNVCSRILSEISTSLICCLWLGMICFSWTRARRGNPDYSGWPPPLRDSLNIYGRPNLNLRDQARVKLGNDSLFFCCKLIRACIKMGVSIVLENPASSRIFSAPVLQNLIPQACCNIVFDHCMFGSCFKKPTRLLAWNIDLNMLSVRCAGRQLCDRSGQPHETLTGKQGNEFKTALGAAYPLPFCNSFAKLLKGLLPQVTPP